MADTVAGMLWALLAGEPGRAYNIANPDSDITLRDLAGAIADAAGTKVVFELPDAVERAGYSTATKALLDGSRLRELGWRPEYDIRTGMARTLAILKDIDESQKEIVDTVAKLSQQKEKSEFHYILFSESGFDEKLTAEAESAENIELVGIERIMDAGK